MFSSAWGLLCSSLHGLFQWRCSVYSSGSQDKGLGLESVDLDEATQRNGFQPN